MPYDKDLDECLFAKSWENEDTKITASVYAYNGGQKKVQLSRENRNAQGELRFAKLGRLTKEEATEIGPMIQEALKNIN